MLAPPEKRERRRKTKERRAADRCRKAKERALKKKNIRLYTLPLSDRAVEGLIAQWIATGQISDEQALRLDRRAIERLLAVGIEHQGIRWLR